MNCLRRNGATMTSSARYSVTSTNKPIFSLPLPCAKPGTIQPAANSTAPCTLTPKRRHSMRHCIHVLHYATSCATSCCSTETAQIPSYSDYSTGSPLYPNMGCARWTLTTCVSQKRQTSISWSIPRSERCPKSRFLASTFSMLFRNACVGSSDDRT